MERRSYERRRVREAVTLHSTRSGTLVGNMHDLSLGGMYLQTGPGGLSQNSTVKVTFSVPNGGPHEPVTLEAVVVRRGKDGCGLMFVRMDHQAIDSLSEALLRYDESATA